MRAIGFRTLKSPCETREGFAAGAPGGTRIAFGAPNCDSIGVGVGSRRADATPKINILSLFIRAATQMRIRRYAEVSGK